MRVALLLALAALSTAVATGCAADSSAPAKANLRAPVEPPAASPFVTIDSPGDRAVTARQDVLGIRAMADVAGRGNAGDLVQVNTGCDDPRCAAGTQVDAAGHWTVRVLLKATKSYPRVRVVAQSGAQVAISLARLGLPEAKTASRKHARTRTARRAASSTTTPPRPRPLRRAPPPHRRRRPPPPRTSPRRAWCSSATRSPSASSPR